MTLGNYISYKEMECQKMMHAAVRVLEKPAI
jgi:hypothetical protein